MALLNIARFSERLFFRLVRVILSFVAYLKLLLIPKYRRKYLDKKRYEEACGRTFSSIFLAIAHYELRGRERGLELSSSFSTVDYLETSDPLFIVRPCSPFTEFLLRGDLLDGPQNKFGKFLLKNNRKSPSTSSPSINPDAPVKVAFYSALIGGYDKPVDLEIPESISSQFPELSIENRLYSDSYHDSVEHRKQCFSPFSCHDPKRTSSWLKTHPHFLFSDFDFAIWTDANLKISPQGVQHLLKFAQDQSFVVASYPHPENRNAYDEAMKIIDSGRDNPLEVLAHVEKYGIEFCSTQLTQLWETRIFLWNLRHPQSLKLSQLWWKELINGCKRDQISLPYALHKLSIETEFLEGPDTAPRNSSLFEIVDHKVEIEI